MKKPPHPTISTLAVAALAFLLAACAGTDRYAMADTDGDDRISPEEFERYMLETIYGAADPDGNAKVTFEEWKEANPDAEEAKFKAPDKNNDGAVTPGEMKAHFAREGTMDDLFAKIDTNGDGYLSSEETDAFMDKMEAQGGSTPMQNLSRAAASE